MIILLIYAFAALCFVALWCQQFWPVRPLEFGWSVVAGLLWPVLLALAIVVLLIDVFFGEAFADWLDKL